MQSLPLARLLLDKKGAGNSEDTDVKILTIILGMGFAASAGMCFISQPPAMSPDVVKAAQQAMREQPAPKPLPETAVVEPNSPFFEGGTAKTFTTPSGIIRCSWNGTRPGHRLIIRFIVDRRISMEQDICLLTDGTVYSPSGEVPDIIRAIAFELHCIEGVDWALFSPYEVQVAKADARVWDVARIGDDFTLGQQVANAIQKHIANPPKPGTFLHPQPYRTHTPQQPAPTTASQI